MNSIEMRSLILVALGVEDASLTPRGSTFKQHLYRGTTDDLRAIVEVLAIKYSLIKETANLNVKAWGAPGSIPYPGHNTNFSDSELDLFSEQIHFLIFQNVISPGARGSYGEGLPYFHVTEYGKRCINEREILPYDPDGYIGRLKQNSFFNEWDEFYISQSLLCYNSGAYEASVVMLGIAAEFLSERLVEELGRFLSMLEPDEYKTFQLEIEKRKLASEKHVVFEKTLTKIEPRYDDLKELKRTLDNIAKDVYSTYLRLNRNEQAHPNKLRVEKIECLSMFISYIKYCDIQLRYLQCLNGHIT